MTVKCRPLLKSNCIHSAEFVFCICWYFFYVSQRDSLRFKSHKATSFCLLLDIQMQNVTLFHYNMTMILAQIEMFLVEEWGPQIGLKKKKKGDCNPKFRQTSWGRPSLVCVISRTGSRQSAASQSALKVLWLRNPSRRSSLLSRRLR